MGQKCGSENLKVARITYATTTPMPMVAKLCGINCKNIFGKSAHLYVPKNGISSDKLKILRPLL